MTTDVVACVSTTVVRRPTLAAARPGYSEAGVAVPVAGSRTASAQLTVDSSVTPFFAGLSRSVAVTKVPEACEATVFMPLALPRGTGAASSPEARASRFTACVSQARSAYSSGVVRASSSVLRATQPSTTVTFSTVLYSGPMPRRTWVISVVAVGSWSGATRSVRLVLQNLLSVRQLFSMPTMTVECPAVPE